MPASIRRCGSWTAVSWRSSRRWARPRGAKPGRAICAASSPRDSGAANNSTRPWPRRQAADPSRRRGRQLRRVAAGALLARVYESLEVLVRGPGAPILAQLAVLADGPFDDPAVLPGHGIRPVLGEAFAVHGA